MESQETAPARHHVAGAPLSRRALLRIGAVAGVGALFALTACALGGGGDEDDDEDEDDD